MSGTAKHYISLFTGAGGLDIGFNEAGFHGLLASDIMPQAKETFILNYPDEPYLLEDIRTLSISEIKKYVGDKKVSVIIGGPPCQGFSNMGNKNSADPRNIGGDPFEILYTTKLVPPSVLTTFAAVPVQDVSGVNIKTLSGRKDIKHFEKRINSYLRLPAASKPAELARMQAQIDPRTPGDTNYSAIRKNYLSFVKQMQMIDSAGELTERGLATYHLGLVNGPTSKLFTDYFIKEVLTTGHHLDVLLDFDQMRRRMPTAPISNLLSSMEADYATRGFIKTNPGRVAGTTSTVGFLKYEQILWKNIGLMDADHNVQWRRITEVCSLPDLL